MDVGAECFVARENADKPSRHHVYYYYWNGTGWTSFTSDTGPADVPEKFSWSLMWKIAIIPTKCIWIILKSLRRVSRFRNVEPKA